MNARLMVAAAAMVALLAVGAALMDPVPPAATPAAVTAPPVTVAAPPSANPFLRGSVPLAPPAEAIVSIPERPDEPPAVRMSGRDPAADARARRREALGLPGDASRAEVMDKLRERAAGGGGPATRRSDAELKARQAYLEELKALGLSDRQQWQAYNRCQSLIRDGGTYNDCMGVVTTVPSAAEEQWQERTGRQERRERRERRSR